MESTVIHVLFNNIRLLQYFTLTFIEAISLPTTFARYNVLLYAQPCEIYEGIHYYSFLYKQNVVSGSKRAIVTVGNRYSCQLALYFNLVSHREDYRAKNEDKRNTASVGVVIYLEYFITLR